ncbi:MAG: PqqD family protein [Oscillospiraceae bacterium]
MKIKDGFLLKKVGGQNVVVALGEASRSFNGIIRLNDTGVFLWEQLQQDKSEEQLLAALTAEYDIEPERAGADIADFVAALRKAALLA